MSNSSYFDIAQICLNGHIINGEYRKHPENNQVHCSRCGEKTITSCPSCGNEIKGDETLYTPGHSKGVYGTVKPVTVNEHLFPMGDIPRFCINCGKPFPWTVRDSEQLYAIVDEVKALDPLEKANMKRSIDDLMRDTGIELGKTHLKLFLQKAGKQVFESFKSVLISIISASVRKQIGI